jgi:hypothetical protein
VGICTNKGQAIKKKQNRLEMKCIIRKIENNLKIENICE